MIIVEGPDGAGKTTLINQLRERFEIDVAPRVVNSDTTTDIDMKAWVENNLAQGFEYKLYDRYRLISEFIYGPTFRDEQQPGFDDLIWAHHQLQRLYNDVKPIVIYCLPPLEVVRANLLGDPDNKAIAHRVDAMYTAYVHRIALDKIHRPRFTMVWDYTTDGREENPLLPFVPLFSFAKEKVAKKW